MDPPPDGAHAVGAPLRPPSGRPPLRAHRVARRALTPTRRSPRRDLRRSCHITRISNTRTSASQHLPRRDRQQRDHQHRPPPPRDRAPSQRRTAVAGLSSQPTVESPPHPRREIDRAPVVHGSEQRRAMGGIAESRPGASSVYGVAYDGLSSAWVGEAWRCRAMDGTIGIVLSGGGARGAYEFGALEVLAPALDEPARIIVGTSAGGLGAAYLAADAHHGLEAAARAGGEAWLGSRSAMSSARCAHRANLPVCCCTGLSCWASVCPARRACSTPARSRRPSRR